MAYNPVVKPKIVRDPQTDEHLPCVMCGTKYPRPDAAHIIDQKEWCSKVGYNRQVNGMPLCPNCHRIFDETLRPRLFAALSEFGIRGLPDCWRRNNKLSVADQEVGPPSADSAFYEPADVKPAADVAPSPGLPLTSDDEAV